MSQHWVRSHQRGGTTLVVSLIVLLVVSLLGASMLKTAHVSHQQVQREILRTQAEVLAECGLSRAAVRRAASTEYVSEKWAISTEELGGTHSAVVTITVTTESSPQPKVLLTSVVEYPAGSSTPIRITKRATVTQR